MKWEIPLSGASSYLPPMPTQTPRLTLAMCGISAVTTARLSFSREIWCMMRIFDAAED